MHNITLLKCIIHSQKIENKKTVIITIWKIGLSLVKKITVPKNAKVITLFIPLCAAYVSSKKNALNFKHAIKGVGNEKVILKS